MWDELERKKEDLCPKNNIGGCILCGFCLADKNDFLSYIVLFSSWKVQKKFPVNCIYLPTKIPQARELRLITSELN